MDDERCCKGDEGEVAEVLDGAEWMEMGVRARRSMSRETLRDLTDAVRQVVVAAEKRTGGIDRLRELLSAGAIKPASAK